MTEPKLLYNNDSSTRPILQSESRGRQWHSYWPIRYACIFLCCLSFFIWYFRFYKTNNASISDEPWDFLLFTQSYPITSCIWWQQNKGDQCHFARNKHAWTVHGIWPTKGNTEWPSYCRNLPFDENALEHIKSELEDRWLSIGNEKDDAKFWKHEWLKHGTCAVEDVVFDSELKYFELGLYWNKLWNVTHILSEAGILPSDSKSYTSTQFHDAVKSILGYGPYLHCYYYQDQGIYIINEIRHCISKSLELVDCDTVYSNYTDCSPGEIYYPDTLAIRRI